MKTTILIIIVVSVFIVTLLIVLTIICFCRRKKQPNNDNLFSLPESNPHENMEINQHDKKEQALNPAQLNNEEVTHYTENNEVKNLHGNKVSNKQILLLPNAGSGENNPHQEVFFQDVKSSDFPSVKGTSVFCFDEADFNNSQ